MPSPSEPYTPQFGEPLPISPSEATLAFLERRRSASASTLVAPAPDEDQLNRILTLSARAPDHGKLNPWRFVVLRGNGKRAFVTGLEAIAARRPNASKAAAKLGKIRVPPLTIAVIARAEAGEIPLWEQELSAGAVCTLMIVAAQAMGFGANWITDWYAYDADAVRLLGLKDDEKVAGYIHIGTPDQPPLERQRPDMSAIVETWSA